MAVGVAIAEKQKNTKVFVVLSDGELQEGSTWEAIMLIPALKLKNVIMIIDNNNLQSLEKTSKTHPNLYPIEKNYPSLVGVLKDVMDIMQNKFLIKFIIEIKKTLCTNC